MLTVVTSTHFIVYKLRLVAMFHHLAFSFDILTQITSFIEDCVWRTTYIFPIQVQRKLYANFKIPV